MTAEDDQDAICRQCDSATLGEWDEILRRFHCPTCSATWRRRPGRLVPRGQRPLPGLTPPMTLETELPDSSKAGRLSNLKTDH